MGYPDTNLPNDTLDDPYGGQPATAFGAPAWQLVWNVLLFLEEAHLLYNRAPYRTVAVQVTTALAAGEVAVVDLSVGVPQGGYLVRKPVIGDVGFGGVRVLGVCVLGASVGHRALVAVQGIVPRTVTGFATLAAATPLAVDYATGRLKVAGGGDPVIAYGDVNGNAHLSL